MARLNELKSRWEREPASRAFLPLAEEFRRLGRLRDAERVCREGLQRHPHYHSARVLLGRTLLDLDRLAEAAEEFRAVLESEPQNLLAGRLLAGIYRNQGQWAEALEIFRRLQTFYPDDAEVRRQVYHLERGPEEGVPAPAAAPSSESAVGNSTGEALATNTLAEIYLGQGLVDRAVAVYENMLRADPDNQGVRRRITEILGTDSASPPAPSVSVGTKAPASAAAGIDPRRRVIQRLQNWLLGIQKG